MLWTPQQQQAIKAVNKWLKSKDWLRTGGRKWFYLGGFAGTGKTTLATHLAGGMERPVFCAFTGKAAQVLNSKGCTGATTVHKLIYGRGVPTSDEIKEIEQAIRRAVLEDRWDDLKELDKQLESAQDKSTDLEFEKRASKEILETDLVVLDECSMISDKVALALLEHGKPVLVLGDPAQLPPVEKGEAKGFFTKQTPDYLITDICRQAHSNPLLVLATRVRKGEPLKLGKYGNSQVVRMRVPSPSYYTEHEAVLVGTNKTRLHLNVQIREILFGVRHSHLPCVKDKIVLLENLHKLSRYNGTEVTALTDVEDKEEDTSEYQDALEFWDYEVDDHTVEFLAQLEDGSGRVEHIKVATQDFDRYVELPREKWTDPSALKEIADPRHPNDRKGQGVTIADFAYALTVHKSQGSQWKSVLVLDDGYVSWKPAQYRPWFYTAITRAEDRVTIILDTLQQRRHKTAMGGWR